MKIPLYEEALEAAGKALDKLPDGLRVLSLYVNVCDTEKEVRIHLYDCDMKKLAEDFGKEVKEVPLGEPWPCEYYEQFTLDGVTIFQIITKTAALSGTEDSGNENSYENDTTKEGECQ